MPLNARTPFALSGLSSPLRTSATGVIGIDMDEGGAAVQAAANSARPRTRRFMSVPLIVFSLPESLSPEVRYGKADPGAARRDFPRELRYGSSQSDSGSALDHRTEILGESFTAVDFGETAFFGLPCVYLMAHQDGADISIQYAGQTSKLSQRYAGHHQLDAAKALGATHALVLVAPEARDRREFETLLRWYFRPPLNLEDIPSHMQAWRAAMHFGKTEIAELARAAHMSGSRPLLPAWTNRPKVARG